MARLKKGMTLLELLIAMALLAMVLMTASVLLISFQKFYSGFMQKQENLGDVSLAALEEIVAKVTVANNVAINGIWPVPLTGKPIKHSLCVTDNRGTPTDTSDDNIMELVWDQATNKVILAYQANTSDFEDRMLYIIDQSNSHGSRTNPVTLFTAVTDAHFSYRTHYKLHMLGLDIKVTTAPGTRYDIKVGWSSAHILEGIPISTKHNTKISTKKSYPTGSSLTITVDENNTPTIPGDDVTYTYWLDTTTGYMKRTISTAPGEQIIAKNITALSFEMDRDNELTISVTVKTPGGASDTFETSVVANGCPAVGTT